VGRRERYEPGTFCWVELVTTDLAASEQFYGELFGWDWRPAADTRAANGIAFTLDGAVVCGMTTLPGQHHESGTPPHWRAYVSVDRLDAALAETERLGGARVADGDDERGDARTAFIKDPSGAVLGLWESRSRHGVERVNDPGCFVWSELHTRDVRRASEFHRNLFGWAITGRMNDPAEGYLIARNNGWLNAGILPFGPEEGAVPPHWLTYFTVTSCDDASVRARELGAEVLGGPLDVAIGRISVVRDPVGAVFAMFEGETDD
jgi:uncharacterized protein